MVQVGRLVGRLVGRSPQARLLAPALGAGGEAN